MSTTRNKFKDPATGAIYVWQENHRQETGGAFIRAIASEQPTKGRWVTLPSLRQQGTRDDLIFKLSGTAPTVQQHEAFLDYLELSLSQTIYFIHAAGFTYECQLTDYEPQERYVAKGPRGQSYIWDYTMQIDVVALLT